MSVILALRRLRQDYYKFEASLGCIVSSSLIFVSILSMRKLRFRKSGQWVHASLKTQPRPSSPSQGAASVRRHFWRMQLCGSFCNTVYQVGWATWDYELKAHCLSLSRTCKSTGTPRSQFCTLPAQWKTSVCGNQWTGRRPNFSSPRAPLGWNGALQLPLRDQSFGKRNSFYLDLSQVLWQSVTRTQDLALLCQRHLHGGGGWNPAFSRFNSPTPHLPVDHNASSSCFPEPGQWASAIPVSIDFGICFLAWEATSETYVQMEESIVSPASSQALHETSEHFQSTPSPFSPWIRRGWTCCSIGCR